MLKRFSHRCLRLKNLVIRINFFFVLVEFQYVEHESIASMAAPPVVDEQDDVAQVEPLAAAAAAAGAAALSVDEKNDAVCDCNSVLLVVFTTMFFSSFFLDIG